MPKILNLTPEERKIHDRELQRKYHKNYIEKKREEKRQLQAEAKADLANCLRDPDAPDAVKAAAINERYGFSIIEGAAYGEKKITILEHISGGCKESRYRVKETSYTFFPSRADALAYCDKAAKHMKFYF